MVYPESLLLKTKGSGKQEMLHLVGETIDKHRAKYGADTGKFVQIMRGIYVGGEDDADAVLFDHALRVAAYLYPNTYSLRRQCAIACADTGQAPVPEREAQRTHTARQP